MIQSVQNSTLSKKIVTSLPLYYREPEIFRRLIRSKLEIIQDDCINAMMCRFMSMMTIFIKNEPFFRAACTYFKILIVALKSRTDIFQLAVPNVYNIKYLLTRLSWVEEETAVELLGLLKVILLVQVRIEGKFNRKSII